MEYEFAPLEGVTDAVYRRTHRRFYPGIARYYTPFISPTKNHIFTPRDRRELAPENNPDVPLVPQLLGKNADDLVLAGNPFDRDADFVRLSRLRRHIAPVGAALYYVQRFIGGI